MQSDLDAGKSKPRRVKIYVFCLIGSDFWSEIRFDDCGFFDAQQGLTKHIAKSYNPAMPSDLRADTWV